MYVTRVINLSLLNIIEEYKEIGKSDLKRIYAKPDPPGIVTSANACFDSDLKDLELEGRITIDGNRIKFIK